MPSPVRILFDGIAHRYDFLNHFLSAGRDVAWRRNSCKQLPSSPATLLLDLCGGTGDFALAYAREVGFPRTALVGDFAFQMLQKALPKDSRLAPVQLDAMILPLPDASVDITLNGFGMRNLPDTRKGLEEVFRVLKPGGQFLTLEFFKPTNIFTRLFYGVLAPLSIPLVGAFFSGRREAYEYLVRSIQNYLSVKQYASMAQDVGFQVRQVHACDGGIAYRVLLVKEAP